MNQRCSNCGTTNTSNSSPCVVCGEPLGKGTQLLPETQIGIKAGHRRRPERPPSLQAPSLSSGIRSIFGSIKRGKTCIIQVNIFIPIIILLSLFLIINHFPFQLIRSPNVPTIIGPDGIGVTLVDGEYIGISDGRYALDTKRDAGPLMLEASESLRKGNLGPALAEWNEAHEKDTSDAEPLIYVENQRVLASGSPYITVVLGLSSLGVNLQAAYIIQKECNENPQLSGGKKLRLLIARSGSNPDRSKDIANQVVQAAQFDQTIVGVRGWNNSETTLNVVKILGSAHLPIVASDTASNDLTGISPYFFRVGVSSTVSVPLKATYIEKKLAPQHLVIFRDHTEPYSSNVAADFAQQFAYDGYHIASTEDFKTAKDAQDGQLAQHVRDVLTNYKPDFLFIATNAVNDVTTVLNTIPATAEYANLKVFAGAAGYELVRSGEKVNGYTHMLISSSAFPDEWSILGSGNPEPPFFKDYIAAYDPHNQHIDKPYTYRRADGGVMMDYDALSAFLVASKIAIQQGKQNPIPEDIKNALSQIHDAQTFQGITGAISFGPDGDPVKKVHFILHVVEGGYTHVAAYRGCFLVGSPCDNNIHILE